MAASLFDSQLFGSLFSAGEVSRLFSDSAEVRAMLLVEGAVAKAQGALGIIPQDSADAIGRAVMEVAIDPGALHNGTRQDGTPVPALVAALRSEMNAPEHAQFIHWGASTQDVTDTALMLRLRQVLTLIETDLKAVVTRLGVLAQTHADLAYARPDQGPSTFGAVAAGWGAPIIDLLEDLQSLRARCLIVSFAGAPDAPVDLQGQVPQIRVDLAKGLALIDPKCDWPSDRRAVLELADWMQGVARVLGTLGQDGLSQSERLMLAPDTPPASLSMLTAMAHQGAALITALHAGTQLSSPEAAHYSERMNLPHIALGAATTAQSARQLIAGLAPNISALAGDQISADLLAQARTQAQDFATRAKVFQPT